MPERLPLVDRDGPGIFDALRGDPSLYFDRSALRLLELDQYGFSHLFLRLPARLISRVLVALIVFLKRILPFEFSAHNTLDRLGIWFLSHCVSAEGASLLLRHFIVETNVLAFIAHNAGLAEPTLRPTRLDQLDNKAGSISTFPATSRSTLCWTTSPLTRRHPSPSGSRIRSGPGGTCISPPRRRRG